MNRRSFLFKSSWILLLTGIVCDYNIASKSGSQFNLPASSIGVIIFIAVFLALGGGKHFLKFVKNKTELNLILSLGVLLAATFLSSLMSDHRDIALNTTIFRYSLFYICFICLVGYSYFLEDAVSFVMSSMIYMNVLVVVSLLLDYYIPSFNSFLIENFGHMEERHISLVSGNLTLMRPSGFITEVNLAALGILMANVILLINIDKIRWKWLPYLYFAVSGYAFGMTVSRSGLSGLVICLVLLVVFKKMSLRRTLMFALIFFAAQALTPQTQNRIAKMFKKETIEGEVSIGRPVIWRAALKAFETKPVTGIGIGVFFSESLHYIDEVLEEQYAENNSPRNKAALDFWKQWRYGVDPHSIIVTMLTEVGIIGLGCFMFVMYYYGQLLVKLKKYNSFVLFIALFLISCFASFAPYYKFYLIICIILYMASKQDFNIGAPGKSAPMPTQ